MIKLKYVRRDYLDQLKNSIDAKKYIKEESPWLQSFFENSKFFAELKKPQLRDEIKLNEDGKPEDDLENIKIVHNSLKFFEPRRLANEGIWVYLTHVTFWAYMKKRWVGEDMSKESIKERFFISGNASRGLLRNGIARLWFIGHATYDESSSKDPYHLTSLLMTNQEVLSQIAERPFLFSNLNFKTAILNAIKDNEVLLERDILRKLMIKFTFMSGIKRLDSFSSDELREMIQKKINSL